MTNGNLDNFIKHIFEDNFAEAKNDLQKTVIDKLKDRMKDKMDEAVAQPVKK